MKFEKSSPLELDCKSLRKKWEHLLLKKLFCDQVIKKKQTNKNTPVCSMFPNYHVVNNLTGTVVIFPVVNCMQEK